MMSPKSIAHWQELKAKKLNDRTVPEDIEYKKLQMRRDADVLALNELKWRVELAEAIMISSMNSSNTKPVLDNVTQSEIGGEQKSYSWKDTADSANVFLTKTKQEVATQNHKQSLGNDPLDSSELPDGSKHSN